MKSEEIMIRKEGTLSSKENWTFIGKTKEQAILDTKMSLERKWLIFKTCSTANRVGNQVNFQILTYFLHKVKQLGKKP